MILILKQLAKIFSLTIGSVLLYLVLYFYLNKNYHEFSVLSISIIFSIFILPLIIYGLIKLKYDPVLAVTTALLVTSISFLFTIFGPVFIDRSLSYHIVFLASEGQKPKTIEQISLKTFKRAYDKRFEELKKAHLIEISPTDEVIATRQGSLISNFLILIGHITNSLETYNSFEKDANENK